jgi:adenylate cyclase
MFLDYLHPTDLVEPLAHCHTARRLRSDLADAHAAEGFVLSVAGDLDGGAKCFRTAINLQPHAAETLYLFARVCMATVALLPAAAMLERAATLRSDDYHALVLGGKVRQMIGDEPGAAFNFARALPRVEARLDIYPDDFRALSDKARCLWRLGRVEQALAATSLAAAHPDPMPYQLACVLASAGRSDDALDVLEGAVERGWRYRAWLDRDPDIDPLRSSRRFKRMIAGIGAIA